MNMREKMARALAVANEYDPDAIITRAGSRLWQAYLPDADAALDALAEPTDAMLRSGPASDPLLKETQRAGEIARNAAAWQAMLAAAKADT